MRKVILPQVREHMRKNIPTERPAAALDPNVVQVLQLLRSTPKGQLNASIEGVLLRDRLGGQPPAAGASGTS